MKKTIGARLYSLVALLSFASTPVFAQNYIGASTVVHVRTQLTYTYVGLETQPANTCNSYGAHFRFDHTTPDGKAFLSSLLLAWGSGRQVAVWYTTSTAIGAVDAACTSNLSVLNGISVI